MMWGPVARKGKLPKGKLVELDGIAGGDCWDRVEPGAES